MDFKKIETINMPTRIGTFKMTTYETSYKNQPNMNYILVFTNDNIDSVPIIRLHSSCLLGETFISTHCDCGDQLIESMKIVKKNNGILFYLDQEGRGHGIINKIIELKLQEKGLDTEEASKELNLEVDQRKYDSIIDILHEMNITKVKILTNNPKKLSSLENSDIEVVERIPLEVKPNKDNYKYLLTKKRKFGHFLSKYFS